MDTPLNGDAVDLVALVLRDPDRARAKLIGVDHISQALLLDVWPNDICS